MLIARFDKMSVSVPIKDDESIEDIEDRLAEAIDSIGDDVVMTYRITITDDD